MHEEVVGLNAGAAVGLNTGGSSWTECRRQQVD